MSHPAADPTIFALASAAGRAGVAIIRVSGPAAGEALIRLTQQPLPPPRQAVLREFKRPADHRLLDRGMAIWFPAPHSFTGENVVELHLHGGRAVINGVSAALAALPGFRLAEAGEFTRRGFENGKFDLTEAEAIADTVHADTEAQLRQALRQMDGELGRLYEGWREKLTRILAHIEAAIDFSDEDLPDNLIAERGAELDAVQTAVAAHLADGRRGERLRGGYSIAILGPPNAGKSSLLNRIAQRDAAIVSATAGTTRDIIELQLDLGGYPVILADTAGLRESDHAIENEGIRRAVLRAKQTDLKLLVFDGASLPDLDSHTLDLIDAHCLIAINKSDATKIRIADIKGHTAHYISLQTGFGFDALLQSLTERIAAEIGGGEEPVLTRQRHRAALEECAGHITRAQDGIDAAREAALIAEDVRLAMRALGRITGRVDVEDLLDVIFRDFCIGK